MNRYFKSLNFKQKNKYLIIGAGAFVLIAYIFAISPTIEAYRQKKALEQKLVSAKNSPQQVTALENRLTFINSKVNAHIIDSTRSQEHILDAVSTFCQKNNLLLKEFPKTSYGEQEDFTLETNVLIVEGNYKDLVRLVYELEHVSKAGKVVSVSFNSSIDIKLKKTVLTTTVYLQNIRIKNKTDERS